MEVISIWVRKHKTAIVIAGLSALLAIIYTLPPQVGWFPWQRLITALGFLVHGTLIPLATLIPRLIDLPALGVALLMFLGLITGLAVEFLWNHACWAKPPYS